MTSLPHSLWDCQEGQGWGDKGSGNELQVCEALSEGSPVTASPLSYQAGHAMAALHCRHWHGPELLQGCCGTPLGSDGLWQCCVAHHSPRGTRGAPCVAPVPRAITRSLHPTAPSLPRCHCRVLQAGGTGGSTIQEGMVVGPVPGGICPSYSPALGGICPSCSPVLGGICPSCSPAPVGSAHPAALSWVGSAHPAALSWVGSAHPAALSWVGSAHPAARVVPPQGSASQADSLQQMAPLGHKNNPVGNKLPPALQLGKNAFISKTQDVLSCSASQAQGTSAERLTELPSQAPTYFNAGLDSSKLHFSSPASDAPLLVPDSTGQNGSGFGATSDFPADRAVNAL
ncbi:uncharacterized protein LOC120323604 [Pipra filicauda]|uniref:Uncharacterized protein LOC120323604 n=1 Tax=Pipra filicauda TaxID=649802 RepID=A0A7R5KBC0_9PASS|nr:uncharacterized protein LOC120323604 [Pipra filicauda]XP_039239012.1 uncharacterized protein LOC120323604 [Pipra filicauda]